MAYPRLMQGGSSAIGGLAGPPLLRIGGKERFDGFYQAEMRRGETGHGKIENLRDEAVRTSLVGRCLTAEVRVVLSPMRMRSHQR